MILSVSVFRVLSHNVTKREMLRDYVQDMLPSRTTVIIRECQHVRALVFCWRHRTSKLFESSRVF